MIEIVECNPNDELHLNGIWKKNRISPKEMRFRMNKFNEQGISRIYTILHTAMYFMPFISHWCISSYEPTGTHSIDYLVDVHPFAACMRTA